MKKLNLKSFISGFLAAILVMSMITTVFAATRSVTATVTYRDIKVNIDGVETALTDLEGNELEPVILFGTVYVPLSPVARAFGKTSTYDGKSFTVFINSAKAAAEKAYRITDYYNADGKFSDLGRALPFDSKNGEKALTVKKGDVIIAGDLKYTVTAESITLYFYTQPSFTGVIQWWADYFEDAEKSGIVKKAN